ncbi:MAG: TonB-dependent receptor [Sphingomonadaceae bacterium]
MLSTAASVALIVPALGGSVAAQTEMAASAGQTANSGSISGTVTSETGRILAGAAVRAEGLDTVATTDSNGRFLLNRVPAGQVTLTTRYFGLETGTVNVNVAPGQTAEIKVVLSAMTGVDSSGDLVVTASRPIAESEEAAIQLKRASTSLVDVIAADSIGRFPDQNIAAALGRLPGVGIARDQGQERFVSLRGAPARWTTLGFDGVNVISPAGRTTRFDTIPSAIASKVIVRKAVTPDMPGETVAGNINVVTRSPFDYPGFKMALDGAYGFNDLGQGKQYNIGGFISDRFANDTIGIMLSASRYERDMITDNFETSWEIASEDREPGGDERIWSPKTQNKLYRLTRSNTAFSGRLEWKPDNSNRLFVSSIWTEFTDDELRNANVFDLDQDAVRTSDTSSPAAKPRTGYADIRNGNTPMQGTLHGAEIESTWNSNSSAQRIFTNTLGGDHDIGDWKLTWRGNYTRADSRSRPPFQSSWVSPKDFTSRPTLDYDFTDKSMHKVHLFETVRNPDGTFSKGAARPFISPSELDFISINQRDQLDRTNGYTGKIDIERQFDLFGTDTTFQFGGQYDRRTKTSTRTVMEVTRQDLIDAGAVIPTQADLAIDTPYKGKFPLGYGFKYFSSDLGEALFDGFVADGIAHVQANTSETNNYKVREEVLAGYLMGTTYFDWGNIVYGARVERVKNTGSALAQGPDGFMPVDVSKSDTSIYPSVHLNWDMNQDMKFRLSFNTGAARPDYPDLRPNFTFSDDEQIVSGGNPLATPERAWGLDAYFEWYMPSRGFFSAGAYYKDLKDILYDVELSRFDSNVLNFGGVDRSGYKYETVANGGGGSIKGLEFSYVQPLEALALNAGLPDWMAGFGVRGTLTFNDSTATTPDGRKTDLPGSSDLIYNVSAYYERYGFSARVSWQWQSEYLDSINDNVILGDTYWAKVGRLDVSVRYALSENAELYLDANNLTNSPGVRYQGERIRPTEYESFGRRYLAGVRVNF